MVANCCFKCCGKCHWCRPLRWTLGSAWGDEPHGNWRLATSGELQQIRASVAEILKDGDVKTLPKRNKTKQKKKTRRNDSKQVGHWCNTRMGESKPANMGKGTLNQRDACCSDYWLACWFSLSLAHQNRATAARINEPSLCSSSLRAVSGAEVQ